MTKRRSSGTGGSVDRDAINRVERTLEIQRERFDRIDQKAANILQFVGLVLGGVLTIVTLGPVDISVQTSVGVRATSVIAALSILVTVLLSTATYATTRFQSSVGGDTAELFLEVKFTNQEYNEFILSAYREAIRENASRIQTNVRLLSYTIYALTLSIVSLSLTVLFIVVMLSPFTQAATGGIAFLLYFFFLLYLTQREGRGR